MSSDLRQQVTSSVLWNAAGRGGQQIIQFGVSIILARLLLPDDFGTIGMITIFTGFAAMFIDMGFGAAIVQRRNLEPRHLDAAFLLSLILGVLLTFLLFLLSPLIAQFYRLPILQPLVQFLSFNFLLIPFGMVPSALLQRSMRFKQLAQIDLFAIVVASTSAVLLALGGWGVWALAIQGLVATFVGVILKWRASNWRPSLRLDISALRDLWGFTINLFGFNFLNYWARNADNLLIGRALGAPALGVYSRAYSLMLLPINQVNSLITGVMFSALSSIQEDKVRVKRIYLNAIGLLSLVTFPLMVGLFAVSEPFILAVYGEPWADVIVPLRILSLIGLMQSVINPGGWIYTSQGQTRWMFWWGIFGSGTLIISLLIGISFGTIEAVALAYAAGNLVIFCPAVIVPGRLIGMRFSEFIAVIYPQFLAAAGMGILVAIVLSAFPVNWSPIAKLSLSVVSGIIIYPILGYLIKVPSMYIAAGLLKDKFLSRT